jgi:hypothetical protein
MQKISARDKQNMKRELNEAITSPRMNFYVAIFKACLMADENGDNLERLAKGFPEEVAFFERWRHFGMDISDEEIVV